MSGAGKKKRLAKEKRPRRDPGPVGALRCRKQGAGGGSQTGVGVGGDVLCGETTRKPRRERGHKAVITALGAQSGRCGLAETAPLSG